MITIFCDFWQFSAKKLAFFSKTNVMIKFLHNLALIWVKNANIFAKYFGENIFKNHNIGPWTPSHYFLAAPALAPFEKAWSPFRVPGAAEKSASVEAMNQLRPPSPLPRYARRYFIETDVCTHSWNVLEKTFPSKARTPMLHCFCQCCLKLMTTQLKKKTIATNTGIWPCQCCLKHMTTLLKKEDHSYKYMHVTMAVLSSTWWLFDEKTLV
jgi:hypothetical protein